MSFSMPGQIFTTYNIAVLYQSCVSNLGRLIGRSHSVECAIDHHPSILHWKVEYGYCLELLEPWSENKIVGSFALIDSQ